jgi:hypothetical protein
MKKLEMNVFEPLKVLSGQIGSAWEWYHWKARRKDINRYMFLIFYFWSWIFEKTSKFLAASCKNNSNLLLVRITVCMESCLAIGWRTFIWWKNPPKCTSILVWIAEWWMHAATQRTIDVSPAFLEHGSAKKIAFWAYANHEPNKQED